MRSVLRLRFDYGREVPWIAATAVALARRGTTSDRDLMILHGGIRAALVAGPDGHRFLVEERTAAATCAATGPAQAREQGS